MIVYQKKGGEITNKTRMGLSSLLILSMLTLLTIPVSADVYLDQSPVDWQVTANSLCTSGLGFFGIAGIGGYSDADFCNNVVQYGLPIISWFI